jgi:energy-coupling factor transport system ATP-binding protein
MIETRDSGSKMNAALSACKRLIALAGHNFSGRTRLARRFTGLPGDDEDMKGRANVRGMSVYIGPEVYNSVSGLGPTVREELKLHAGMEPKTSYINEVIESVKLNRLYDRNPFDLSGGEQASLTVISALALEPKRLALDGALEQVDMANKQSLLQWLQRYGRRGVRTVIVDNHLDEFAGAAQIKSIPVRCAKGNVNRFDPINDTVELPVCAAKECRINLEGLRFRYGKSNDVLRDVTVEFEPGRLYFLEGRNGAGKTTLAKILSGYLRPTDGEIRIDGLVTPIWRMPGQIFAYHFQNPDVELFRTNVESEIEVSLGRRSFISRLLRFFGKEQLDYRAIDMNTAERARRRDATIEAFGLNYIRMEHPLDLPFVMRKRVALAATVAMGCPWLILDEPTLGQDRESSEAIARIIEQLLTLKIGIIVISHSAQLRQRLSAHSLRLSEGVLYQ